VQDSPTRTSLIIRQLRAEVLGRVIAADDAGYDEARTVFVGGVDRRPAVIVRVANAADVAHVISLARETGLELAVRSGGTAIRATASRLEGSSGTSREMKALDIDVGGRTA
jgi:FAD/FMN-containing dehydrogenase